MIKEGKMERLTSNKPVDEMSMVELAHNSCYAENQKAMYRDFEMNMDARDFARNLMVTLTEDELSLDDDTFDEEILENLQYDPFSDIRGLIALFYRNLWAMADLRERLAAYEDTNLLPEKITEIDKLYLEKCQEVNRLNAELAELKKQPQGELISRSELIEALEKFCGHQRYLIPEQVWEMVNNQPTAYDVDAVVEQLEEYREEMNRFGADGILTDMIGVVRNGGKE